MADLVETWFPKLLGTILARMPVEPEDVSRAFHAMLDGSLDDSQIAAFLIAMRMKGETAEELAAAARVLRRLMVRVETGRTNLLDTCGTGGDDLGTFNISTAAALVVAGAGVPVVKHGNRAVSSHSGSADVLSELGVPVEAGTEWARQCLDRAGLSFCFAPQFHPALRRVGPVRKRLGVRTMMNLLGPLANPAEAAYQLLGVGRSELLDPVAGALAQLGTRAAFVVCSAEGLDEVSLSAPTWYREVRGATVTAGQWTADDFGLDPVSLDDVMVSSPAESAQLIERVLAGKPVAARQIVLANAAAALFTVGVAGDLRDGVEKAANAIDSGRAAEILEMLRSVAES